MLTSASSEFVALCREQMAVLARSLGASLSIVYLTQELVEAPTLETKLIPVAVYPEAVQLSPGQNALLDGSPHFEPVSSFFRKQLTLKNALTLPKTKNRLLPSAQESPTPKEEYLRSRSDQIVLPLIHENVVMGFLVTGREDRPWNEPERNEIESIVQTLTLGCILDRRRIWLEMQLQQQQILQERQRDLLDNLLHQFRNPLTALRTFGKLLLKRLRPGDANREVAASIVRESDRLEELLKQFDKVIDLTAADLTPLLPLQNEVFVEATVQERQKPMLLLPGTGEKEVDCFYKDLLEPLLVSAKAIARERNLTLIAEIPPNLPKVRVNFKALQEVLNNIIDNALKYTPAGGKILIQAGQEKANYQGVAISDNGPGIPVQDLEHLGERHYRGVQAQTAIPGTGLGLAIAKQLIEQMHGEIQVFSPALNWQVQSSNKPGTTFVIWLPEVKS
ncbi:MAG: HAMP domain-containing histidine kinase [Cyanomargarita calcarea GSE-NOS-MK-12-04C]|jgi:signal transduction histidine kinase|uniref:histidine kinase n=1 Tax=Cyanomargarita calcarea GSE-NOS-MK-12-04C TaxID=2839659 RepID=A0A951QQQ1_9CYAN|nr:HAMP domain-containing histidine kinase [Cyanomargarita calcarea GSE-NOS-MK-12-04C]